VQALEAAGAEVLILQADVSDPDQMRAAIAHTLATFGSLHGVFHTAGVPSNGLISRKTPEMVEQVLAPKVVGTLALIQAVQKLPLDFLVLFSSLCSMTGGGPGQVDYCAANAFLDALAQHQGARGYPTIAIDWGEWQWNAWEAGLAGYPAEAQHYFKTRRQRFGIGFAEGMAALCRVLQSRLPRVIISSEDFQRMVAGSEHFSSATILQELTNLRQTHQVSSYTRPLLGTEYVAPTNELEQEIATRWSELLGIEQVGIHDNFFELGGHSLLGTQLMARLRQVFQIDIRLTTLFEAPTISELAMAIEMALISELEQTYEESDAYVYER
jgi:acyl carrier protein